MAVSKWRLTRADYILATAGAFWAFFLGLFQASLPVAFVMGALTSLFTLVLSRMHARPPEYGPHH